MTWLKIISNGIEHLLTVQNVVGPDGPGECSPRPSVRTAESNTEDRAPPNRVVSVLIVSSSAGSHMSNHRYSQPQTRRAHCLRGLRRRKMRLWLLWCAFRIYYVAGCSPVLVSGSVSRAALRMLRPHNHSRLFTAYLGFMPTSQLLGSSKQV